MSEPIETTATDEKPAGAVDVAERPPVVEIPVSADAPSAGAVVHVHDPDSPRDAAVVAAAEAALAMPGAPGRDEFLTIAAQARMISMSGAAPEAVKGNPFVAFHVAMIGRDLGISVSAAIELIDVINTSKGPRISLSPQLINGQIRRLGLGSIRPIRRSEFECVAGAYGPTGELLGESEFTWEDARMASLVGSKCEPGDHKSSGNSGCGCNQGYKTYPKRMLWWRASGFAADDYFPEAGLGLYTAEELGAVVDVEGRPIDPANVELPAGYEAPPPSIAQQRATTRADLDELWSLQERVFSLPADQQKELRERWQASDKLKGVPVRALPESKVQLAKSMINGFVNIAKRSGWNPDDALADVRAQESWRVCTLVLSSIVGRFVDVYSDPDVPLPAASAGDVSREPAESPAERPDDAPGTSEPGDTSKSADAALAAAPVEVVEGVVAKVQAMSPAEISAALSDRGLSPMGNPAARAKRLAERLVIEAMAPFE